MADSVLSGSAPLTRSANSGGLSNKEMMEKKKYGEKTSLRSFGRRSVPIEKAFDQYFDSVANPVDELNSNFKEYLDFQKKARKEDMKHQGRGGIIGMFKEFVSFRLWKKLFGLARDPQIAALHQIRDILISVHDPKGKKNFKARFGIDPGDFLGMAGQAAARMFKETDTNKGFFGRSWEAIVGLKDIMVEDVKGHEADRMKNLELQGTIARESKKQTKSIAKQVKMEQKSMDLTEQQFKEEKFNKFAQDKPKGKSKMSSWLKWLGLGALLFGLFGKKGLIATAAAGFFIKVLPLLLGKGISLMFKGLVGGGKLLGKGLIGGGKMMGKGLKALGTAGGAGAAVFAGLTMSDYKKSKEEDPNAGFGKRTLDTMLGTSVKGKKSGTLKNIGKQTAKYAGLGAAIGSVVPGVGTAVGAAVGAGVGFVSSSVKAMVEKGVFKKMWGSKIVTSIRDRMSAGMEYIKEGLSSTAGLKKMGLDFLKFGFRFLMKVNDILLWPFRKGAELISEGAKVVKDLFTSEGRKKFMESMKKKMKEVWTKFTGFVGDMWNKAKEAASKAIAWVKRDISGDNQASTPGDQAQEEVKKSSDVLLKLLKSTYKDKSVGYLKQIAKNTREALDASTIVYDDRVVFGSGAGNKVNVDLGMKAQAIEKGVS